MPGLATRVLVATLLLPMLLGMLVLWSLGNRVDHVDSVPAAVVNLDHPVHTGTGNNRRIIAAGRLLAGGLTQPADPSDKSLGWQLTNAQDARAGLRDGSYYAVVTIPPGFSKTLTGLTSDDPRTASISVRSNDASSALVGMVSDRIGAAAADRLGRRVTATYLEGIYAKTATFSQQLGKAADGAGRLADGGARLHQGTVRAGAGAEKLSTGLGSLSAGALRLRSGAGRLAGGASALSAGTSRLSTGASKAAAGTTRLAGGLSRLHQRTSALPDRTRRLADGAGKVSHGVSGYARLLTGWATACKRDPVLTASHARLCALSIKAVGLNGENADALTSGARRVAGGADRLADVAPRLTGAIGHAAHGSQRLADGTRRLEAGARKVDRGAQRLAEGAVTLGSGADRLAGGASTASAGAGRLAGGTERLTDGSSRLSAGSATLADRLEKGSRKVPDLSGPHGDAARVLADPVDSSASRLNPTPSTATNLAPGVLAFVLWLGAFVTYLVRDALPARVLSRATTPARAMLAGYAPALLVGAGQSLLLLVALVPFDVSVASPFALTVFLLLAAAVFAAVNQALVAALGRRRGWIASIVLAVLQLVSLGGFVPISTAPATLQWLASVLPVTLTADALGHLTLGGQVGSVVGSAVALGLWAAASLTITTVAASRRQRVTLSDVRRRVSTLRA
jgi:putative membrane protein